MLDLTVCYETEFESNLTLKEPPVLRVSEVERCHISKNARAHFYTFLAQYLNEQKTEAAYCLGIFYRYRKPCGEWFRRAVEYWTFAAGKGDWHARWFLYELYNYGEIGEIEPDPEEAFKWLVSCYETLPAPEIGVMIARRYLSGQGTARDPEKAKEYYIKGVLQNDARSKHELDTLITALHNAKLDADGQAVELECMREIFKRCGVKFRDD